MADPDPRKTTAHAPVALSPEPMDPPARPGAMATNILAHDGELLVSWLEPAESAGTMRLRVARHRQGRWSPPATVVESTRLLGNWADIPVVVAGPSDTRVAYYLARSDDRTSSYDLMVAHSRDRGDSWEILGKAYADATPGEHGFVSSVLDGDGVRAFWLDGRAVGDTGDAHAHGHASGAMSLRTTLIRGTRIDTDELIDDRVCDCCGTAAAMTADGPIVVYRDRDAGEIRDIASIRRVGKSFTAPVPVHRDNWQIVGCPVNGPRVVARGRHVAVAWYTYADQVPRVRVAFSDNAGQSFAAPIELDGPRDARAPLGRVDLVLADDQPGDQPLRVLVVWMASERERALVLARRVDQKEGPGEMVSLVETRADRTSGFPRLARLGQDLYMTWVEPAAAGAASQSRIRAARFAVQDIPAPSDARPRMPMTDSRAASPLAAVGLPAPAYEAVDLAGNPASLVQQRGAPVLLNIWATWCEPCRHELPELSGLHRTYAPRGLRVIGVSVDHALTHADIQEFVSRRDVPYTIWHDPGDRASSSLGVTVLPASLLLDMDGTIRWTKSGGVRADDPSLLAAIEQALPPATDANRP